MRLCCGRNLKGMPRRTCERQSQNAFLLASARNLVCFALVIIDGAPASRRHWHEWALSVPLVPHERRVTPPVGRSPRDRRNLQHVNSGGASCPQRAAICGMHILVGRARRARRPLRHTHSGRGRPHGCLRTLRVRLRRICPPKQSFFGAWAASPLRQHDLDPE